MTSQLLRLQIYDIIGIETMRKNFNIMDFLMSLLTPWQFFFNTLLSHSDFFKIFNNLGPVVQSIVSLTKSLVVNLLSLAALIKLFLVIFSAEKL